MTKIELVARALTAMRAGRTEAWHRCRADAHLVLAACGQDDGFLPGVRSARMIPPPANDPCRAA